MLGIYVLPVGEYATNCYLLTCPQTRRALLVDPGADPQAVLGLCAGVRVTRPAFQEFLARPRPPDLWGDVTWA